MGTARAEDFDDAIRLNKEGQKLELQGKYYEALEKYKKGLQICRELNHRQGEGVFLGNIGLVYQSLGQYEKALKYHKKSLEIHREIGDRDREFRSLWGMGLTYHIMKDNKKAINCLKKAVEVIEEIRGDIKIEEMKSSFFEQYLGLYKLLIEILIQENKPEEALEYAERSKARNFLDSIGNRRILPRESGDRDLAEKEEELLGEIRSIQKRMQNLEGDDFTKARDELENKRKQHARILEKLKMSNPEYASLVTVVVPGVEEIKNTLGSDEILVEYFIGKEKSYVWAVTGDKISYAVLPKKEKLVSKVKKIRRFLAPGTSTPPTQEDTERCKKELSEFYSIVLKPVEKQLEGKKTVIIVPHSVLHYVPFCAMMDGDGKYMVEKYNVLTEPSASSFVLFRRRKEQRPWALGGFAIGDVGVKFGESEGEDQRGNYVTLRGGDWLPDDVRSGFAPLPGTADNLLATLWSVEDQSTRDLMVEFYRQFLDGCPPPEALRKAQLKIMKTNPHPFYWSSFIIYGKGE